MQLIPQIKEEVPYIYLPFVEDVVDMTQASQTIIDTEIAFALNGNWNTTDWGNRTDFWKFFITHYGHYRILQKYTEEQNNKLICDHVDFNVGSYPVLMANHEKYDRLANSLKTKYNVLEPYNIHEEHSFAGDSSKTNQHYDTHTDTNYESSMDNTTSQEAGKTTFGSHTDYVDREHTVVVTFEDNAFESNRADIEHSKDARIGNIGNHSYADLIEKEIKLARYNLWDIISKDLLDNICLKFFMSC